MVGKILLIYLFFVNVVAFAMYGIDKRKAVKDQWRIPTKAPTAPPIRAIISNVFSGILH